jgi:hypothetical protein
VASASVAANGALPRKSVDLQDLFKGETASFLRESGVSLARLAVLGVGVLDPAPLHLGSPWIIHYRATQIDGIPSKGIQVHPVGILHPAFSCFDIPNEAMEELHLPGVLAMEHLGFGLV